MLLRSDWRHQACPRNTPFPPRMPPKGSSPAQAAERTGDASSGASVARGRPASVRDAARVPFRTEIPRSLDHMPAWSWRCRKSRASLRRHTPASTYLVWTLAQGLCERSLRSEVRTMSRTLAILFVLCVLAACSGSRSPWQPCSPDAGDAGGPGICSAPFACVLYYSQGTDGLCHGVGSVCALACTTNSDCKALGANAVCSSACPGAPVCVPYQ